MFYIIKSVWNSLKLANPMFYIVTSNQLVCVDSLFVWSPIEVKAEVKLAVELAVKCGHGCRGIHCKCGIAVAVKHDARMTS